MPILDRLKQLSPVVILTVILAVFSGLYLFYYEQNYGQFRLGAFDLAGNDLKNETNSLQMNQGTLIRVTNTFYFTASVLIVVLLFLVEIGRKCPPMDKFMAALLGLLTIGYFVMMIYYSVKQKYIIDDVEDDFNVAMNSLPSYRTTVMDTYGCSFPGADIRSDCANVALLPLKQFWFVGTCLTIIIYTSISYAIKSYAATTDE